MRDPAGAWHCNDDDASTDPLVRLDNPAEGPYYVWVGTFGENASAPGTLYVTQQELTVLDVLPGGAVVDLPESALGDLNLDSEPNYGRVELSAGFAPQPYAVAIVSGGGVGLFNLDLGEDCVGWVSFSPDYVLDWSGATDALRFAFTGDDEGDDPTLMVMDPAGTFHCNDDFDGLFPRVVVSDPPPGRYLIWAGSFDEEAFMSGTLSITE